MHLMLTFKMSTVIYFMLNVTTNGFPESTLKNDKLLDSTYKFIRIGSSINIHDIELI